MSARIALAAEKGCDAVDADNVDAHSNETGLDLVAADQLEYNRWLAATAHDQGLAIGLKNDVDQVEALESDFDFAINTSCFVFSECDVYARFVSAGKAVFQVEFGGESRATEVCALANARDFSTLVKNEELDAFRIDCLTR